MPGVPPTQPTNPPTGGSSPQSGCGNGGWSGSGVGEESGI
jgi:hypothetical protein